MTDEWDKEERSKPNIAVIHVEPGINLSTIIAEWQRVNCDHEWESMPASKELLCKKCGLRSMQLSLKMRGGGGR